MASKKVYEAVARAFDRHRPVTIKPTNVTITLDAILKDLERFFTKDSDRFDVNKFRKASSYCKEVRRRTLTDDDV
jgi:hypothetical protein